MAPRKSPFDPWKPPKQPKRSSGFDRLPTLPTGPRMARLPRMPRPSGPRRFGTGPGGAIRSPENGAEVRSSEIFRTITRAIDVQSVVRTTYEAEDQSRELCLARIGTKDGVHYLEAFQTGGFSKSGLPAGGEWRCFRLMSLGNPSAVDGEWRLGERESEDTRCFDDVVYTSADDAG